MLKYLSLKKINSDGLKGEIKNQEYCKIKITILVLFYYLKLFPKYETLFIKRLDTIFFSLVPKNVSHTYLYFNFLYFKIEKNEKKFDFLNFILSNIKYN